MLEEQRRLRPLLMWLRAIFYLYLFLLAIKIMGGGFKGFKPLAEELIKTSAHPLVGLFIGILATSIVQSSSCVTSIVVALCAAGSLRIENAVYIIMGANIGTTVTNTLVSSGYFRIRSEFRNAAAASTIHDFFNIMTVAILMPFEYFTGYFHGIAEALAELFHDVTAKTIVSPVKLIVGPVEHAVKEGLLWWGASKTVASIIMIVFGLFLLFFALIYLTKTLRAHLIDKVSRFMDRVLGRSGYLGLLAGFVVTAIIQSSSVTTSLLVPLAASGIVTLEQIYPITLGANIGTTVTAVMASIAAGVPAGMIAAFHHVTFNLTGTFIFYVIPWTRRIPLFLARKMGNVVAKHRWVLFVYIVVAFYGVTSLVILLYRLLGG